MPITEQHTEESLCLAHIYALAGVAGVNYGIRKGYDYGVDGQFNEVITRGTRRVDSGFPLDFQAKATIVKGGVKPDHRGGVSVDQRCR